MSEWIWLVLGAAWGIWVNLGDARHYKNVAELQKRLIQHLYSRLDGEENDKS